MFHNDEYAELQANTMETASSSSQFKWYTGVRRAEYIQNHNSSLVNSIGSIPQITGKILSRVRGSVTNSNGFWIGWLYLLTSSFIISLNQSIIELSLIYPLYISLGHAPFSSLYSQLNSQLSQSHIATDGQSVSQSVFVSSPKYLLLLDSYVLVFVGRPFWREDGSVFCQSHCLQ
jgi:hypothetical protein